MPSQGRPRSRLRDYWRWTPVIGVIGSAPCCLVALDRKRYGWAAAVAITSMAEAICLGVGVHLGLGHTVANRFHGHPAGDRLAGVSCVLWLLTIVLCWCVPNPDARPAPPWPAVTDRARALTARYGLIAYAVSFGGAILIDLLLLATGAHIAVGPGVLSVDALLLITLVPLIRSGRLGRRDLGLRATRPAGAGLAVAAFVVYIGLSAIWALALLHPSSSSQTVTKQFNIPAHPGAFTVALDVFAMAVSAPVCEEIFFRGLLFRCLRNRMTLWPAALIAGSLFGLVHATSYPLNTIPIKMLFGVLMCLLYERTGSLLPGIAVHSFVDGSGADLIFTGNPLIALAIAALVLVIVGGRAAVIGRRERPVEERPSEEPQLSQPGPRVPWSPHVRDS